MYALESNLRGQPVISLQTGQTVAIIGPPVLDIANLEVKAFMCETGANTASLMILVDDIRQFAGDCLIIDDEEQLTEPGDIVRLGPAVHDQYTPLKKAVYSDTGRHVGSVIDYNINLETLRVQQLIVRPSWWRSWFGPRLVIDRIQILDVTPDRITVRDATVLDTVIPPDSLPEIHP